MSQGGLTQYEWDKHEWTWPENEWKWQWMGVSKSGWISA